MEHKNKPDITVETYITASIEDVWRYWTEPEHIMNWYHASDDWYAPYAENDLRINGKFKTTMAAKDGSMSFDFEGNYTNIQKFERIEYKIIDGRKVEISFNAIGNETKITEVFEPENMHTFEIQKNGWQSILDNFKEYIQQKTINMPKQIWVNLPVKNVDKSVDFFTKLGFSFNHQHDKKGESACLLIGEQNFVVMLFEQNIFSNFTKNKLTETEQSNEVLFSIDAQSKEDVDEFASKVEQAGGKIFSHPEEIHGWMYGFGFCDLDGHRWNMLYMDLNKLQNQSIN
ncbi:MAG: SRPBCC domain-containing protein [Bacteroidales bacterium]